MYIIKCDRCGNEHVANNLFPIFCGGSSVGVNDSFILPKYSIYHNGADGEVATIHLCEDCLKEFEAWLKNT